MSDRVKEMSERFGAFLQPTGKFSHPTRYGVGTIGAVYDSKGRVSGIDPEYVCALTHEEYDRYRRAYDRQVSEGALRRVTVHDYVAFLDKAQKSADATAALNVKTTGKKSKES